MGAEKHAASKAYIASHRLSDPEERRSTLPQHVSNNLPPAWREIPEISMFINKAVRK